MINIYSITVDDIIAAGIDLDNKDINYTLWECVDTYEEQNVIRGRR